LCANTPKALVTIILIYPLKETIQVCYSTPLRSLAFEKIRRARRILFTSIKTVVIRQLQFDL
jgi:hypothetical protein